MGARERRVKMGPAYTMTALGVQLWFMRDERGEMQRPRGSNVGVVRVSVLMRTCAYIELRVIGEFEVRAYSSGESLNEWDGFSTSRIRRGRLAHELNSLPCREVFRVLDLR